MPICGTVNVARLKAAKSVKFRIFHGDADNVVTPEGSRAAYRTLKKEWIEKNIPEEEAVEKLIELIKANGDYEEK